VAGEPNHVQVQIPCTEPSPGLATTIRDASSKATVHARRTFCPDAWWSSAALRIAGNIQHVEAASRVSRVKKLSSDSVW
jgi:hypothetical protein